MYYLQKKFEVSSAHTLTLDYDSKCSTVHGHNWYITVYCKSEELNNNGMIIDFNDIKNIVMKLDHKDINDFIAQPTAENIAQFLCHSISFCYKVKVEESQNNIVTYERI